jgi:hypothetical protein
MIKESIDYGKLVDQSLLVIVRKVLTMVQQEGLPGNHHFFVSFMTKHSEVKLSKNLLDKYPREMTIVIQHQFEDLNVEKNGFSVTLSFSGVKENIYIPFASITAFADPSVQFGLQFREAEYEYTELELDLDLDLDDDDDLIAVPDTNTKNDPAKSKKDNKKHGTSKPDNVIILDKFRNK